MSHFSGLVSQATKRKLARLSVLVAVGAAVGVVYMPFVAEERSLASAVEFALQGVLITGLVFGFEFFVEGPFGEPLRRARFGVFFLVKAGISTLLILTAFWIGGLLLFPERFADEAPLRSFTRDTLFALAVGIVLQFLLLVRRIVGGRVLGNLVVGRYHLPLFEERIFLFLDVSGSTRLAESLGPLGAYAMISRFFFDVAQETTNFGGETHRYIGDEVVVTWPLAGPRENARCLSCYFAVRDRIQARAADYQRKFGAVPQFRAGLHAGTVVAGACGDDKREIVYFGDTINTAARIQEASKRLDRPLLVSRELLDRLELPVGIAAEDLGNVHLRGRGAAVRLFAVGERRKADRPLGPDEIPRIPGSGDA